METAQRLRYAISNNKLATAKLILEQHPELLVNTNISNGWSNLHYAAYHGHYQVCVYLVNLGHDRDEISLSHHSDTAMHLAAKQNQEQTLHYLAQHYSRAIDWRNADHHTPLMQAVISGHDPCVNILLDFGADIDSGDAFNTRPIHVAAARGHVKIIRTLVDRGADTITLNDKGWSPSDYSSTFQVQKYMRTLTRDLRRPPPLTIPGVSDFGPVTPVQATFDQ